MSGDTFAANIRSQAARLAGTAEASRLLACIEMMWAGAAPDRPRGRRLSAYSSSLTPPGVVPIFVNGERLIPEAICD